MRQEILSLFAMLLRLCCSCLVVFLAGSQYSTQDPAADTIILPEDSLVRTKDGRICPYDRRSSTAASYR